MKAGIAELIDRLIILNLKIWHLEEAIRDPDMSNEEVGKITRVLTTINEQGTAIKAEIDELVGAGLQDLKVYGKKAGKRRVG
jgi:hypothetical protein